MSGKNKTLKIGIFGGSFDPVHLGHIGLAKDALEQAGLDKVVLIPAKLQPFKLDKKLASGKDRVAMLELEIRNLEDFEISTFELEQESVSYTYLTLRAMQEKYGENAQLFFITGTDAFLKIDLWKNAQELLTNYSFIIGTRPGYRQQELDEFIVKIRDEYGTDVVNINNTQIDVSSTEIREILEKNMSAEGLISPDVERYIKDNGLYR